MLIDDKQLRWPEHDVEMISQNMRMLFVKVYDEIGGGTALIPINQVKSVKSIGGRDCVRVDGIKKNDYDFAGINRERCNLVMEMRCINQKFADSLYEMPVSFKRIG